MHDEKYALELELVKRNLELTKLKLAVLDAEIQYKKLEDAESKPTDYAELANPALPVLDAEIKAKKVEVSGVGYITYPKAAVDEINAVITSLIENVAAGHFFRDDIPWRLERVLKFLNSYKVNALEEVPGAKPKDSVKENTAWRHSLTFCDELTEDHYRYFSGKPKVEEAKPKDSGEGYITYRKEYVDYLMDVLGDFITRFENLNNPTWAEQLSHAVALLRKDSKVRVTDWEEYKFQWRNGRERLKSTKLQQTLRTEDGEESAKRCGRFQRLGDMGRPA